MSCANRGGTTQQKNNGLDPLSSQPESRGLISIPYPCHASSPQELTGAFSPVLESLSERYVCIYKNKKEAKIIINIVSATRL